MKKWQWVLLIAGSIAFGVACGNLLDDAFEVDQIRVPLIHAPSSPIRRWCMYKQVLDSMSKDSIGKFYYDSIKKARPGLLDSLEQLEQLYHYKK